MKKGSWPPAVPVVPAVSNVLALASKIVFRAFSLEMLEPKRFCG
jgi:hypothetical protein